MSLTVESLLEVVVRSVGLKADQVESSCHFKSGEIVTCELIILAIMMPWTNVLRKHISFHNNIVR